MKKIKYKQHISTGILAALVGVILLLISLPEAYTIIKDNSSLQILMWGLWFIFMAVVKISTWQSERSKFDKDEK